MKKTIIPATMLGSLLLALALSGCGGGSGSNPAPVTGNPASAAGIQAKTGKLAAPTGVTATGGINMVNLSWNQVADADSYNIYWSSNPNVNTSTGTKISVKSSPYRHEGLTVSQTYFYVVTAVSSTEESLPTEQVATVSANNGAELYNVYCQGCHGAVALTHFKIGTPEGINAAIAANRGGMGNLPSLSPAQIELIATQLPCH